MLPSSPASRRAVLAGPAALALTGLVTGLTGCGSQSAQNSSAGADDDPDLALLDRARAELGGLTSLVQATRRRHRQLRGPLTQAQRSHEAALARLTGDLEPIAVDKPDVAPTPELALEDVRDTTDRVRRHLLADAIDAQSGPLARLLASASAGLAQQLVLLPLTVERSDT